MEELKELKKINKKIQSCYDKASALQEKRKELNSVIDSSKLIGHYFRDHNDEDEDSYIYIIGRGDPTNRFTTYKLLKISFYLCDNYSISVYEDHISLEDLESIDKDTFLGKFTMAKDKLCNIIGDL